jgi:hypothetical protein
MYISISRIESSGLILVLLVFCARMSILYIPGLKHTPGNGKLFHRLHGLYHTQAELIDSAVFQQWLYEGPD